MSTSGPTLSTRALGLSVGGGDAARWLVRHLDLELSPGTITTVVGPNGAGKSTLLRALAGLLVPAEGEVRLADRALPQWPDRARAQTLAYLPQATGLVHDLRVADVVALGRAPHRSRWLTDRGAVAAAVQRALSTVNAEALTDRRVSTLSGGERQRVMLARMLATGATQLLMDEPTTALDIGHALALHQLLRTLANDGHGVVIAMHDLDAARRLGDQAIVLDPREADGGHHLGPAAEVIGPEVIAPVFGVAVRDEGGRLLFEPADAGLGQ